ncbi:hypothetical protein DFH05DRAFT_1157808 [Lentinula detonsa]|uniref:Uncharacterized protein n=1 Tax=Lentinula detonsa TaxID=2804962 RepID=A0A9W8P009_9AGAR|nr:hypothetical protein DFH05DRAFT_1157808 [Lentinula detonsa]
MSHVFGRFQRVDSWLGQIIWGERGKTLLDALLCSSSTDSPRNAAKARVKDSTGRAQKRHFGAQRLNLAANRGTTGRSGANDPGSTLDSVKTNGPTRSISDIKLAHARQHSPNTDNQITGYIPAPIRISPCTPKSKMRLSKLFEDSSGSGPRRLKPSKVLQALDTCERMSQTKYLGIVALIWSYPSNCFESRYGQGSFATRSSRSF